VHAKTKYGQFGRFAMGVVQNGHVVSIPRHRSQTPCLHTPHFWRTRSSKQMGHSSIWF